MTSAADVSAPPASRPEPAPGRPVASYRTDLVTTLLGTWFTVGLFLDAWAHNNVPNLETFFTPWHAVFYSGFVATAGWIAWTIRGAWQPDRRGVTAMPIGYASSAVAIAGFAVAGVGDGIWHTVFGIEQSINILFSPTHLGLIASMLVIVTTPLRAAWANRSLPAAPGLGRLLPALLSASLATTLVLLFLQYGNAFVFRDVGVVQALSTESDFTARLVASMAITNLVLIVPLLTLARRWVLPIGTATMLYAFAGALSGAVTGLRNLDMVIGLLVAGVCVDILARVLRPSADRLTRFRAFAFLASLLTWTSFVATAFLAAPAGVVVTDGGPHAEGVVELVTGTPVVQALAALLIAVLLVPSAARSAGGRDD